MFLNEGFKQAILAYPEHYVSDYATEWYTLFDDEPEEEIEVPHTWKLVDAIAASFRTPDREGQLVLQEHRPGCKNPLNHWGYMIARERVELAQRRLQTLKE